MNISQLSLIVLSRVVVNAIFRIHADSLNKVPLKGPLIIITNHVNIMEIPLLYAYLQPRKVHGYVLSERWKNPLLAWGLNSCEAIPLQRGKGNFDAFTKGIEILQAGKMIIIMPEGTRSGDGRLQIGYPGAVLLSIKSNAPVLPVVSYGGEGYKSNIKKLRRTDFTTAVGNCFHFTEQAKKDVRDNRKRGQIVDEIMYEMASLLPPEYRGRYSNLPSGSRQYITYE